MSGLAHLLRSDPAFYVFVLMVAVGLVGLLEYRTRPRKGWTPFEDEDRTEFEEVDRPVHGGCNAPDGCLCYARGMRTHAERAGCVFRVELRRL